MPLSLQDATKIVKKALPAGKIQKSVEYKGLYLFQVFTDDPFEEEMDPFYSVNKETGEFRDFSVITDGDITEIAALFNQ
jgi:hypothetical protein